MNELVLRLGSIGDVPGDDAEMLLRHRLMIFAGILMSGGGLLWGTISVVFELYWQSLIPYGYVVLTAFNLCFLYLTKDFGFARTFQISISMLLPFGFQWSLGGFAPSGAVMIWSILALVGSLAIEDRRTAWIWLVAYIALTVFSGVIEPYLIAPHSLDSVFLSQLFFVMNVVTVSSVVFFLTFYFAGERDRAVRELAIKNRELEASQHALVQSEKLAAIGELVAGVAHELNTPLGAIRASVDNMARSLSTVVKGLPKLAARATPKEFEGLLSLLGSAAAETYAMTTREERHARRALTKQLSAGGVDDAELMAGRLIEAGVREVNSEHIELLKSDEQRAILEQVGSIASLERTCGNIELAADRSSKIVFALKNYAHPGSGGSATTEAVADALDTVLTLYHNQIKRGVELECRFDDDTRVTGHHDELNQVWTNLIHNAIQAMNCSGGLTVGAKREDGGLRVDIVDDGPGIPEDVQSKIFEPFFTTKSMGEGTGLGLSICRDIVVRHGGTIDFESRPGRTRFSVFLPQHEAKR